MVETFQGPGLEDMTQEELERNLAGVEERLASLERSNAVMNFQVGRLVSDMESEKDTRARVTADMKNMLEDIVARQDRNYERIDARDRGRDDREREIERKMNIGIGLIVAIQFIIPFLLHLMSNK